MTNSECVFCQIVSHKASASIVYEENNAIAFMTMKPFNKGHVLVIPKKHITSLKELDEATGSGLFRMTTRAAAAIRKSGLRCEGISLLVNDGEPSQKIIHIHFHVLPRYRGDNFIVEHDQSYLPSRDELDETARTIRKVF